jgi:hypothetical protein
MAKPKTPEHLQRCEDAAAKLLQGKKKISHADVLRTFRLIKAADWPTQVRPNVAPTANPEVTGLVLGLSPNRQGGCSIAQASQQCPSLTQVVTKWIRDTLPDAAFRYGSIQVNYNYRARKHIDSNNLGPSYIVALGSFEGGQLWTGDRGVLDCREKWCLFDGNTEHATEPYSGKDRSAAASETFVEPRRRRRGDNVASMASRRTRFDGVALDAASTRAQRPSSGSRRRRVPRARRHRRDIYTYTQVLVHPVHARPLQQAHETNLCRSEAPGCHGLLDGGRRRQVLFSI